jgi:two-component system chemotaxis sensor kinase CheA
VLRRSLRTQITTRVVALSATAALLLGAALVVLIVAVTGQRDAARTAFRSQQALALANQLEKSLLSIESGLNRYIATQEVEYLVPVRRELAAYPATTRRLADLVSDDPGQQRRARAIGDEIADYDLFWASVLPEVAREDGFAKARSQIETNGGRQRLDAIRLQFAHLFDRERVIAAARESSADSRSSWAIGLSAAGLTLVVIVTTGLAMYLVGGRSRRSRTS